MKRFPNTLNILGTKYKVKYVNQEEMDKQIKGADGVCDKTSKIIYVLNTTSEINNWATLFHEFGHALINEASLDQGLDGKLEEIIVDLYSKQIVRLLFGNCKK